MNKSTILFLILFLVLLSQIDFIKRGIVNSGNHIKVILNNASESIVNNYRSFINQSQEIKTLLIENQQLINKVNQLTADINSCKELKYFKYIDSPNLVFTKTISYVSLPDFTSIYIDYPKKVNKSMGLVYNNLAAGIVVKNIGDYSEALLNSNKNTVYAVYIGENKIPGIFYGGDKIVKYISKFKKISVGDVVITSGLDGIFYEGAMVGKVIAISQNKLYQEAKIETFFNDLNPKYFYVVELNKTKGEK